MKYINFFWSHFGVHTLFPRLKGASSRSTSAQKLKGEEKMLQMNEKPANLQ